MTDTAARSSWNNSPIVNPKRIELKISFTEKMVAQMVKGHVPKEMEDKWFIFHEDNWFYFHRSWTGHGIYRFQLHKDDNGYSTKEIWVEQDPKHYDIEDDKTKIDILVKLIMGALLNTYDTSSHFSDKFKSTEELKEQWGLFGNLLFAQGEINLTEKIKSTFLGLAVGDALGVPVEFKSCEEISRNPVTDMIGYGTYHLPPGTFSDDSSLTFCLAEALTKEFNTKTIAENFLKWQRHNYWTARGNVFDIGIATRESLNRIENGTPPEQAGGADEYSNGNGSLMRISPLIFYLSDKNPIERFQITRRVSSITHRHIRSIIACYYYTEFGIKLLSGRDKFQAYTELREEIPDLLNSLSIDTKEIALFHRLLNENIFTLPEDAIQSSGYVIHTLEAGIWCLLTTDNYKDAVLKAVNLGYDTDTTATVTGALAGLLYGHEQIPAHWLDLLARREDIEELAGRLRETIIEC